MKLIRQLLALTASSIASLSLLVPAGQASASPLVVNSISVVYPGPAPVIAGIHLTSPSKDYPAVYVSPQYLNGTMDGQDVQIFAYCVDVLHYSGPGTFDVVSLLDYLGGDTTKYNVLASLIGANDGTTDKYAGATVQAAVWDAMYDTVPYDLGSGNFYINNVYNDATLVSDANALLAQAASSGGTTHSNLQFFVAKNSDRQDMLFWSTGAVPEPATWAMMLIGFAAIGIAVRRSKQAVPQLA